MSRGSLYSALVPDAPPHPQTEVDPPRPGTGARRAAVRRAIPGLQSPRLISSYRGSIDRILFCFPAWVEGEADLVAGYRSVITALREGTRFVVVHNLSIRPAAERWFADAGHPLDNVEFVPLPDYVSVTDWAEDAYVAVTDTADGSSYLMEPWEFARVGDALIADAVEEHTDLRASTSPLIFQGGNSLVGNDFWMLGKDYFADSVALVTEPGSPVVVGDDQSADDLVHELFSTYVDADRRLVQLGTRKPIAIPEYAGRREGNSFFLDLPSGGVGTFQPIFHIDMFVTLIGENADGRFEVLVGSPDLADQRLETTSPYALADVYDGIATFLARSGFVVRRNPLVHRSTVGQKLLLRELRAMASAPDGVGLLPAIADLTRAGARDSTSVRVRDWHHVTWNNCLVENSSAVGRHVYLPTFGHGDDADLSVIDNLMRKLWEDLDFTVHPLADFNGFARRQGVVHCIKKYLARGD